MKKLFLLLLLWPFLAEGQNYLREHTGVTIGLTANFGSHINAVGINAGAYYTDYFFQVNAGSTIYFYGKGYGGRTNFWESRNHVGLVLLGGKKQMPVDFQFDGLNHQTNYNLGLGYNYIWYFDNIGTSQRSGGFAIHIKNFTFYHENDVFAGNADDRYRTGHFYLSYRDSSFKLGTGIAIWTGETRNGKRIRENHGKMANGYKIIDNLPYGKTSHGNGYVSFVYNLPYQQNAHLRLGIDSEHFRHAIQNRLVHDLIFLPKGIDRNSCHYPRLDKFGFATFEKEEVRPSVFYTQFGINENWSN